MTTPSTVANAVRAAVVLALSGWKFSDSGKKFAMSAEKCYSLAWSGQIGFAGFYPLKKQAGESVTYRCR